MALSSLAASLVSTITGTQAANLQGYWKCDESVGATTLADSSGNSKTLTLNGGYTLGVAGQSGTAVSFNGTSGYASRTDSVLGASVPSTYTILFLCNGAGGQNAARLVAFGSSSSANPMVCVQSNASDGPGIRQFWRNDANATVGLSDPNGRALDSTWHMGWARRTGSTTIDIGVDDRQTGTVTVSASTTTLNRTAIGALLRSSAGNFFSGSIQHVAVWNTALSDNEIATIFAATQIVPYLERRGAYEWQLLDRSSNTTLAESYRSQGVAFDGIATYYFSYGDGATISKLRRLTRSGTVYTVAATRDITADDPATKTQSNGITFYNGYLWLGANNYATTPKLGWITKYDTNLNWVATYSVGANWAEGGAWKDVGSGDEFWAVYTDTNIVRRYNSSFVLQGTFTASLSDGMDVTQSQGMAANGLDFIIPMHNNNASAAVHVYGWNGSGLTPKQIIVRDAGTYGFQGISWEVPDSIMLVTERGPTSADQTIARYRMVSIPTLVKRTGMFFGR